MKKEKLQKKPLKKKRKLAKASEDADEPQKKLKLSTISSVNWDLRSILSDPETALEPLKTFLSLQQAKGASEAQNEDAKEDSVDGVIEQSSLPSPNQLFTDACDSYIDDSPEFVHLFTLLDKWGKKNSELKVALELIDALLLLLLTRRRRGDGDKEEEEEEEKNEDDEDSLRYTLQFGTVSKRLLQEQTQIFYKLMDNRNNASQIKAALRTLTTITAGGPSGVRLILDHVDLTHPNFPSLFDRRDKRDEKDVRLRFILLLVGLLVNGDGKSTERLLDTKGFVQGFFAGLLHDSSSTVFLFLAVFRERILENPTVSKSRKVKIFHEKTLKELSALLSWRPGIEAAPKKWNKEAKKKQREREAEVAKEEKDGEIDEETRKVRETVANFLRFLLTNAKQGIAFKIEDAVATIGGDDSQLLSPVLVASSTKFGFSVNDNPNHLITAFLKTLHRSFTNVANRQLALDILVACPDQVFHFLHFHSHVLAPRPTDLWKAAVQFLIDLLDTLPLATSFDGGDENEVANLVESCVPKQFLTGANSISTVGLKHADVAVVTDSLRFLIAVMKRANRVISTANGLGTNTAKEAFSRQIAKILPPPSDLVASSCFESGNLALQAREDLPRTLTCLDHLIRALTAYSELAPQALVEDDCGDVYRVLTMTAFLCDSSSDDVVGGETETAGIDMEISDTNEDKNKGSSPTHSKVEEMEEGCKDIKEKNEENEEEGEVEEAEEDGKDEEEKNKEEEGVKKETTDCIQQQLKDLLVELLRLFSVNGSLLPQMIRVTSASNKTTEDKTILKQFLLSMRKDSTSSSLQDSDVMRRFLIKALTSQSYLKEAAVEVGIWFRHLCFFDIENVSDGDVVIDFVEKTLSRLVSHPYPWMDEVMDYQEQAENEGLLDLHSDSASESGSVASADSIIDAVLSIDPFEENIDADVVTSSIDGAVVMDDQDMIGVGNESAIEHDEMDVDTSLALPFSPFITAAFVELKQIKTDRRVVVDFILKVLYDVFHTQMDGRALSLLLRKQTKEECLDQDTHILSLVRTFHPQIMSPCGQFIKYSNSLEELLISGSNFDFDVVKSFSIDSLLQSAFQSILYVTQLVDQVSLATNKAQQKNASEDYLDITVNWKIKLPRLFKVLHCCLEGLTTATSSSLVGKEAEIGLLCARIYEHPSIQKWFLRSSGSASLTAETKDSIAYEITVGVSKSVPLMAVLRGTSISLASLLPKVVEALRVHYARDVVFPSKLFKEAVNIVFDNFVTHLSQSDMGEICRLLSAHPATDFLLSSRLEGEAVVKLSVFGKRLMLAMETLFAGSRYNSRPHHSFVATLGDVFVSLTNEDDKKRIVTSLKANLRRQPSLAAFFGATTVKALIQREDSDRLLVDIFPFCSEEWRVEFEASFLSGLKSDTHSLTQWKLNVLVAYFGVSQDDGDDAKSLIPAVLKRLLSPEVDEPLSIETSPFISRIISRSDPESIYLLCDQLVSCFDENILEAHLASQLKFFSLITSDDKNERLETTELIGKSLKYLLKLLACGQKRADAVVAMLTACNLLMDRMKKASVNESAKIRPLIFPLWSKLVKRSLKTFFKSASALEFVQRLVSFVDADAAEVLNGLSAIQPAHLFSMIVSHSQFIQVLLNPSDEAAKSALVALIVDTLPHAPKEDFTDESAANLIKAFMSAYSATLSSTDQNIFTILAKFDSAQETPLKPTLWGKALLEQQSMKQQEASLWKTEVTMESVLNALDVEIMQTTVQNFPLFRMLDPLSQKKYKPGGKRAIAVEERMIDADSSVSGIYDPGFLLPLLLEFLTPSQLFSVKKFVQRRCLAFLLAATSSHFESVRLVAYAALGRFERHLEGSRFAERSLYQRFLSLVKNSIEKPGARIPSVISAFFVRASLIMLSPEDEMYCEICNFILLKPVMDLTNVPEYYLLFNSSNPLKFGKDRQWIMELMRDGLVEKWDYIILEKRQAIRTIQALLLSDLSSETVKLTTVSLEILRAAVKIPRACFELVLDQNFLSTLTILSGKLNSNQTATKIIAEIFVIIWKTIDAKASKSEVRIDSIAATYCRALLSCLPNCLGCINENANDEEVIKSLCVSLYDALSSIHHEATRESVIANSLKPLELVVNRGLRHVQTRDVIDDSFVDAILDIVLVKKDIPLDKNNLTFVMAACSLFAESRHSNKPSLRQSSRMSTPTTERFLTWLGCEVMKETNTSALNTMSPEASEKLMNQFLTTYEKILVNNSGSSWDVSKLKACCQSVLAKISAIAGFGQDFDDRDLKEMLIGISDM